MVANFLDHGEVRTRCYGLIYTLCPVRTALDIALYQMRILARTSAQFALRNNDHRLWTMSGRSRDKFQLYLRSLLVPDRYALRRYSLYVLFTGVIGKTNSKREQSLKF